MTIFELDNSIQSQSGVTNTKSCAVIQAWSSRIFVTAASFLNITAITGIANLSEISYYEILANEHHHISPQISRKYSYMSLANLSEISFYEILANEHQHISSQISGNKPKVGNSKNADQRKEPITFLVCIDICCSLLYIVKLSKYY